MNPHQFFFFFVPCNLERSEWLEGSAVTANKLSHIIRTGKVEIIPNLHSPPLFVCSYHFVFTDMVGCVELIGVALTNTHSIGISYFNLRMICGFQCGLSTFPCV